MYGKLYGEMQRIVTRLSCGFSREIISVSSRIFQLSSIVRHHYQSVQCVCVCVCVCVCACACIFCIIMLEHLSIYTLKKRKKANIFHLDVHYVYMLVQRFEPQGRRFTNFHDYYY